MANPWPFHGRAAELERVARALGEGRGATGVLLAGPPGSGKSWLLAEARHALERTGRTVLVADASEETRSTPLGALSPLLPVLVPERGALNLLRWAAEVLLEEATGVGAGRVPVLCVDDVHLMDPLSTALARRLVREGRLGLLAAGELPPGLRRLWEDRLADRIDLAPFSREETEALLARRGVDRRAARRWYERSRGHPLFLRELALSGEELPARVVEYVQTRTGPLRELLEVIAFAEPVAAGALAELVDPVGLEAAEAAGLVTVEPYLRCAHPLYAEVLRDRCPRTRARRHRRALARVLGGPGLLAGARRAWAAHDGPATVRLAAAAREAGAGISAALLLAAALIWAERYGEAEAVLADCAALPMGEGDRARHAVLHAYALSWGMRRFTDAERVLAEAEPALGAAEMIARRVALKGAAEDYRGALDLAATAAATFPPGVLPPPLGVPSAPRGAAPEGAAAPAIPAPPGAIPAPPGANPASPGATPAPPGGPPGRSLGEFEARGFGGSAPKGLGPAPAGGVASAENPAPPALEARGQGGGAPEAGAAGAALKGTTLLTGIAVAQAYTGHPLEARRLVTAAADRVGEDPTEVLPLHLAAFAAEFWSGDLTGAWRAADAYAEALGRRGDALYGAVLLWRGQVATALTRLRASHPGAAAHAAALVGDAEMAERYLAAGEDQWTELARPWVAVAAGRVSEGAELAAAYASRAAAAGLVGFELLALHDVARLGGARRVAARVAGLRHEGALAAAVAAHVAAAAERSGPGLWAASVEFERLGYLVFAAEAAAGALRAGTPGAAARAHMLASRCEGARTPLLAALAAPALTRRELEIATLAAAGLTSRTIATRLGLSPRTVDNHLTSAYAKLGITSRGELPGVLGPG